MLNTFRSLLRRWTGRPVHGRATPMPAPSPYTAPEKTPAHPFKLPEHLHLHWHVSDITQIPAQLIWHSPRSVEFNALESTPQPTSQSPAYDPHLLDNARTQWQFGDWDSLVNLQRDSLEQHPERAKLALLAAAGHQQVGDMSAARDFVQLARDWGCDKQLISRVLVAGVYNTLGKAAAIGGQQDKALGLLEQSVKVGMPGGEGRLLIDARTNEQLAQLSLIKSSIATARTLKQHNSPFAITQIGIVHNLGEAWASNTVNTVIFRHHGILTRDNYQFTAFYADEQTLRLVRRHLTTDTLETNDIVGNYNLRDAHNSISLGIDRDNILHISYDHHSTQLRYRRSTAPLSIADWSDELPMTGVHEQKVTYPSFILPYNDQNDTITPLMLLYRDGTYNKGTARIKTYDETTQRWTDRPKSILSGAEQQPWTSNAYWNHPAIGSDGSLHLSFVWRTDSIGQEQRINNSNIGYACSLDNGLTWQTSHGQPYQLPITQVNGETVYPVSPGCNLINQTSMALDSRNHPHIVFYADDAESIPQYQHLWFDGKRWQQQIISKRTTPFVLAGSGTLQIPMSRPEVVIDRQDNVYVLFRADITDNQMSAVKLSAPDYLYQAENCLSLWSTDLGFAEPIIDRSRWQTDNILSLLLQYNQQPNGDFAHESLNTPVTLIDFSLN